MKSILIIDDDDIVADGVRAALELEGFDVRVAYDGATAIASIRASPPDIVISDIDLPDMSGIDVHDRVCQSHRDLPFIFVSGSGEWRPVPRAFPFLKKPYRIEDLLNAIASVQAVS